MRYADWCSQQVNLGLPHLFKPWKNLPLVQGRNFTSLLVSVSSKQKGQLITAGARCTLLLLTTTTHPFHGSGFAAYLRACSRFLGHHLRPSPLLHTLQHPPREDIFLSPPSLYSSSKKFATVPHAYTISSADSASHLHSFISTHLYPTTAITAVEMLVILFPFHLQALARNLINWHLQACTPRHEQKKATRTHPMETHIRVSNLVNSSLCFLPLLLCKTKRDLHANQVGHPLCADLSQHLINAR